MLGKNYRFRALYLILSICILAIPFEAFSQGMDPFLTRLIADLKSNRISLDQTISAIEGRIASEKKSSDLSGLFWSTFALGQAIELSGNPKTVKSIRAKYLSEESLKHSNELPIYSIFESTKDYYLKSKNVKGYHSLFNDLEKSLPAISEVNAEAGIRFQNVIELSYQLLNYYLTEQLFHDRLTSLATNETLFKSYTWNSNDHLERLVTRAKIYRFMGDYSTAEKHLEVARSTTKIANCVLLDEELELKYAKGELVAVETSAKNFLKPAKGAKIGDCGFEFYDMLISSLLAQEKYKEAQTTIIESRSKNNLLADIAEMKLNMYAGNAAKVKPLLSKIEKTMTSLDFVRVFSSFQYHLYKDQLIAAIYIKDQELYRKAHSDLTRILKSRSDNSYYEPLISAWQVLGNAVVFGQEFNSQSFESMIGKYSKTYGSSTPEVVMIKRAQIKLTKKP